MASATQTATETLREAATEASEVARDAAERARGELDPILRRADELTRQLVSEHPLTALFGAVAAGYAIGRVLATRR